MRDSISFPAFPDKIPYLEPNFKNFEDVSNEDFSKAV